MAASRDLSGVKPLPCASHGIVSLARTIVLPVTIALGSPGQEPASKVPLSPAGCKCVRYDLPITPLVARAVVYPHAGALALFSLGRPTGGSAFLLLAVGLDDVDAAELVEAGVNQLVEPRLRQFPMLCLAIPLRVFPAERSKPRPVGKGIG